MWSSAADGLPPVIVAVGGQAAHDFALLTRQVFSKVTGEYVDFAANGTTDIITNVVCFAVFLPLYLCFDCYNLLSSCLPYLTFPMISLDANLLDAWHPS